MSSFVYTVTFLPEQRKQDYFSPQVHYRLADGYQLRIYAALVWCRHCGAIKWGEQVPTVEDIDQEHAREDLVVEAFVQLMDGFETSPESRDRAIAEYRAKLVHDIQRRRQWALDRRAKPKCLDCGSTDILHLPHGKETAHPAASGTIVVECTGRYSGEHRPRLFTPEGDSLPHGDLPP